MVRKLNQTLDSFQKGATSSLKKKPLRATKKGSVVEVKISNPKVGIPDNKRTT